MTNREIIQKADLFLQDLASNGGQLNPEQSNTFIRKLIQQPTVLRVARVVTMGAPQREINKIGFGSRILEPGPTQVYNTNPAPVSSNWVAPTTEQILLNTKEVIAQLRIPYAVLEDNIERGDVNFAGPNESHRPMAGGLKETIVTLMAERAALDLEELAINGDTGSGDSFLALNDGYLLQATANTVNNAGAGISKAMFKNGLQAMPDQYLRNLTQMRHMVSVDNEIEYRDDLANRETGQGDAIINGSPRVFGFGVPVEPVSLMPAASGLLTNPLNLIFGIQRQISIEVDKDIRARAFIIVLSARVDFKIEEPDAVVRYDNIV